MANALFLVLAFFFVPCLAVAMSPGFRSFLVAHLLAPWLAVVVGLAAHDANRGLGDAFLFAMVGVIVAGWAAGSGWWIVRAVGRSDDEARSPVGAAVSITTGYATAAAALTLFTLPVWQPLAVGLLR